MSLIESFIKKCQSSSPTIAIAGDSMIDNYFYVDCSRISPEFPIPVLLQKSPEPSLSLPGGAANVAAQIKNLGCKTELISFANLKLDKTFIGIPDSDVYTSKCLYNQNFQLPIKQRFYSGDSPLCRIDIEPDNYGVPVASLEYYRDQIFRRFQNSFPKPDVLILSDYGKGFFSDDCGKWCKLGIPTIVDPKHGPANRWQGATVFKPNSMEAVELSEGRTNSIFQAAWLNGNIGCESTIITQGGSGVCGYSNQKGGIIFKIESESKIDVRSVVGAGDCFSAIFALAMTHGFNARDCSEIAFKAGQAYVQNIHNRPITFYDLLKMENPTAAKYIDPPKDIDSLVFTNGVFDLLHHGHLALLKFAKSKGSHLIVALNSDESVRRLKGNDRPIRTLKDRMEMIANMESVDFVTSFDEDTPDECLNRIKPNCRVVGTEYIGHGLIVDGIVKNVHFFPMISGISTTLEIDKIASR